MTDKPKTIQEALAEVQRNSEIQELKQTPTTGSLKSGFSKLTPGAKSRAVGVATTAARNIGAPAIGAGAGFLAGKAVEKLATGTETGRNVGKWIGDNVPGAKTAADALKPVGDEIRRTFGAEVPKRASDNTDSKPAETPKPTETPPAGSAAAKTSFADAYAKARQMAKAAGKDENLAQFKWSKDGGPEKTYQAAATKADYVTKNKQFAVDINAPSTTKNPAGPPSPNPTASTTPKADATSMPPTVTRNIPAGSEGAKYPAEGGVRQAATGTFEKGEGYATIREPKKPETESGGKKKMSEEHINELSNFGAAFAAARRAGQSQFSFGGKSFNTRLASPSSSQKPAGPYGAPGLKGPASGTGSGAARVTRLDTPLPPRRPEQGAPAPKSGSSNETLPVGSGAAPRPGVGEPGGQTSAINAPQTKPTPSGGSSNPPTTSGDVTPKGTSSFMSQNAKEPESESGGKKKKMSEETNPLIAAFLKLQSENPSNMFEAAKKAKKDYDKDGKVESPKDEVWGSRFRAAKAAGKMEEAQIDEVSKSLAGKAIMGRAAKGVDAEYSGDEKAAASHYGKFTKTKERFGKKFGEKAKDKMTHAVGMRFNAEETEEVELDELSKDTLSNYVDKAKKDVYFLHGDPKRSETKIRKQRRAGIKAAKEKLANEEVEFSQAEIDYINSFFEAVAPSRPEPTKGVNPSVSNISLTDDTLEEGRPRKNPTPETTERDARQHIQVQAGRAAGGTVVDFKHDNGKVSKLTPGMGRAITAHLNTLKPAERQEAVKRMHASPEGLKI